MEEIVTFIILLFLLIVFGLVALCDVISTQTTPSIRRRTTRNQQAQVCWNILKISNKLYKQTLRIYSGVISHLSFQIVLLYHSFLFGELPILFYVSKFVFLGLHLFQKIHRRFYGTISHISPTPAVLTLFLLRSMFFVF